jgi:hypothetical protein
MPYCPICRGEYRQGFTVCAVCDAHLVASLDQAAPVMDDRSMAEYLAGEELVLLTSMTIDKLKPLKNLLCRNGIANMIARQDESCGSGNCITGGCATNLDLVIAAKDIERAADILRAEFKQLAATVDELGDPDRLDRAIELDAESFPCPACEGEIKGGSAECPHCGLYVGVPDEFLASD